MLRRTSALLHLCWYPPSPFSAHGLTDETYLILSGLTTCSYLYSVFCIASLTFIVQIRHTFALAVSVWKWCKNYSLLLDLTYPPFPYYTAPNTFSLTVPPPSVHTSPTLSLPIPLTSLVCPLLHYPPTGIFTSIRTGQALHWWYRIVQTVRHGGFLVGSAERANKVHDRNVIKRFLLIFFLLFFVFLLKSLQFNWKKSEKKQ